MCFLVLFNFPALCYVMTSDLMVLPLSEDPHPPNLVSKNIDPTSPPSFCFCEDGMRSCSAVQLEGPRSAVAQAYTASPGGSLPFVD